MLLIARYNCFVAGTQTDSVDYQVRHFDVARGTDLIELLENEPTCSYKNSFNETVEWHFSEIVSEEWEPNFDHGSEVLGFVTGSPVEIEESEDV